MKKRFTESQIVAAIKKQEAGVAVKDICREVGISDATFYNWKANMAAWKLPISPGCVNLRKKMQS